MLTISCFCGILFLIDISFTVVPGKCCEDHPEGQVSFRKPEIRDIRTSAVDYDQDYLDNTESGIPDKKLQKPTNSGSFKQWNQVLNMRKAPNFSTVIKLSKENIGSTGEYVSDVPNYNDDLKKTLVQRIPPLPITMTSAVSKISRNRKSVNAKSHRLKLNAMEPSNLRIEESENKQSSNFFQNIEKRMRKQEKKSHLSTSHRDVKMKKTLVRKPRSLPSISTCRHELSCRNNCTFPRNVIYSDMLACYCDVDCELFQDCCADYGKFCKGEDNWCNETNNAQNKTNNDGNCATDEESDTDDYRNSASNSPENTDDTSSPDSSKRRKRSIAIQKNLWGCFSYPNMTSRINGIWMIGSCPTTWPTDDIFYQCRNLSVTNKITKNNYRYLPVYTSKGTVYHNRFCAHCNGVPLDQLKSYQLSMDCDVTPPVYLSFSKNIDFLFTYCNKISWEPRGLSFPRRYCLKIRDSCRTNVSQQQCTDSPARVVSYGNTFYKNVLCAECNGLSRSKVKCGPSKNDQEGCGRCGSCPDKPHRKPLSVLFDFSGAVGGAMPAVKCTCENVYDKYLGICRTTLAVLPKSLSFTQYDVAMWIKFIGKSCEIQTFKKSLSSSSHLHPARVTDVEKKGDLLQLRFKLRLNETIKLSKFLQNALTFTSPVNITIRNCKVTMIKAAKRLLSCSNLQVFRRNEYTVLGSAVVIKSTGEVLHSNDYYIDGEASSPSQSVLVCRHNQALSCSKTWVFMKEGEFVVLNNKAIFVNSSARFYNSSEYIWQNRSLFICENYDESTSKNDHVLIIVTDVCMSISIIALVFVLVTYSLFSELRTPPGINHMNLSVAILLSQLLWLIGNNQTDRPMACTIIAVFLHSFFLVSFVWTSIIAFDTWRAFTAKGRRSMADSKRKRLLHTLRCMAVGWLSAMVYVAICVGLDLTNTVSIGYQSSKVCWMSNKMAVLYIFASPVALILVFNFVMYILTMKAITATTAQARAATDHKNRKTLFIIYVRIASALGFTWILGFIAPFGMDFLWYPFVVLNGLQGLYIALAFGLNQRARRLWRMLFGARTLKNKKTSTRATKNSDQDITSASVINESRL